MANYDIIIKGGTVVDGTRLPRYKADVAIKDGRIAHIGGLRSADADQVLDAAGLIVAPGFVDLHTHYDAQIQWDPWCTISGWHGVTSVVLGNCGFGFAPVRPEERDRAMLMMSRTEAIPYISMKTGMLWDWVTFPQWLDTLDRIPKGVNCLSYVPLSPLMIWTMGLKAAKSRAFTSDERSEMQRLLGEAMDAGACGFSLQRLGKYCFQADYDGTPMPTDTMTDADILALAEVLRRRDEGFIQITQFIGDPDTDVQESIRQSYLFQEKLGEVSGRPILHNAVVVSPDFPDAYHQVLDWLENCHRRGVRMFCQGTNVRSFYIMSFNDWNLYDSNPAWNEATTGSHDEKLRKLADPELRGRIKAEGDMAIRALHGPIEAMTVNKMPGYPQFEPYVGRTLGEIAVAEGKHHIDVMLDFAVATDLKAEFRSLHAATSSDADRVADLMLSPYVVAGISDGGAHTKFLTLGTYTTDFLMWLVRDTGKISLEDAHYHLSYLPAHMAGFKDRGFLREGAPADIVVYDLEKLKIVPENDLEVVHDFPGGEWRRVRRSKGYRWTLVNGKVTFEDGNCTGATPGKLLRHGKAS
ncbi:MAG: N-acyl-D-amino-acid deacylase family protein [Candidatus Binataceae bacterium]